MKRVLMILLLMIIMFSVTACSFIQAIQDGNDPLLKNWRLIERSSKGGQVTLAIDQKDEKILNWFRGDFKNYMQENYEIDLIILEQPFERTIEQLEQDKLNEQLLGQIDLVYISNKGFKTAHSKGLWYGPFIHELPNVRAFIDPTDLALLYKDGVLTDGYLLPFGQDQLTMIYNRDVFFEPPTDLDDFFETIKDYKGTFLYPNPKYSKEGEAFVISVLLADQNISDWMTIEPNAGLIQSKVQNRLEQLKSIKPYMYGQGAFFPDDIETIDRLFFEEELLFSMSMNYNHATEKLQDFEYPEGAHSFVFNQGTLSYLDTMAIVHNAPNKSASMVVLNALLNPDVQASKYDTRKWGQLPIYTDGYASSEAYSEIRSIRIRPTSIRHDLLLSHRIPEIPYQVRDILVALWNEAIFGIESE